MQRFALAAAFYFHVPFFLNIPSLTPCLHLKPNDSFQPSTIM